MDRLVNRLQQVIDNLSNPATLRGGQLILTQPKTHTTTLQVGDVYVDGEGHLRIRQVGWPLVESVTAVGSVSSVTISIT
jgi:hypothetical protein